MTYSVVDLPVSAPESLAMGLTVCAQKIIDGARSEGIITSVRRAIAAAKLPRGASPTDVAQVLLADQLERVPYVGDPYGDELMIDAAALFCVAESGACVPAGDCNNQVIGLGARLRSAGIPVRLVVGFPADPAAPEAHLWLEFDADALKRGKWKCLDPSMPGGRCDTAPYREIIPFTLDELDPGGKLISMGHPASTLGADAGASLPASQADSWTQILGAAAGELDRARARLHDWSARYAEVRTDLGEPPFDPSPSPPSATPLLDYTASVQIMGQRAAWTAEASNQEQKILQAADFMAGALAEALSGSRTLYWHAGDLFVEAKKGDPYAVLLETDSSGNRVPAFVDIQTGEATGTFGNPILIGLGIVAVALGAVYAVVKICDYLSQAHRDDATTAIAQAQQKLVDSGKESPAEAADFMRAAAALASAPPPGAAGEPAWPWGKLLAAAGLGIAGGVLVSQFAGRLFALIPSRAAAAV